METDTSGARAPTWMKVGLSVSLGFNLVILGAAVGAFAFGGSHGGPRGADRGVVSTPLLRALPEIDQRVLRQALRAEHAHLRESRSELRAARAAMVVALRQEAFDAVGFATALEAQRRLGGDLMDAAHSALLDHMSSKPLAERQAYADRLEAFSKRRAGRRE